MYIYLFVYFSVVLYNTIFRYLFGIVEYYQITTTDLTKNNNSQLVDNYSL